MQQISQEDLNLWSNDIPSLEIVPLVSEMYSIVQIRNIVMRADYSSCYSRSLLGDQSVISGFKMYFFTWVVKEIIKLIPKRFTELIENYDQADIVITSSWECGLDIYFISDSGISPLFIWSNKGTFKRITLPTEFDSRDYICSIDFTDSEIAENKFLELYSKFISVKKY